MMVIRSHKVKNNSMPRIKVDVQFQEEWCKGCGYCTQACERGVYRMKEDQDKLSGQRAYVANPERCVGCGYCEMLCPDNVIAVIGSWGLNIPRGEVSHGKRTNG